MTYLTSIIVSLCVLASTACGVVLPEKWERLTCKVITDSLVGTGFLLRYKDSIFIVSNKHVLTPGESEFYVGLNPKMWTDTAKRDDSQRTDSSGSQESKIIPSKGMYFSDPNYDLEFVHITSFASLLEISVIPESMIGDDSMIVAGREIFFLGYPAGMSGYSPRVPLVRSGIIAGKTEHMIILDGNIFGGSSGSPVFLAFDPRNDVLDWHLIGIVSQFGTMPVVSNPTVEENMGIGIAIKISYIIGTIENWLNEQE